MNAREPLAIALFSLATLLAPSADAQGRIEAYSGSKLITPPGTGFVQVDAGYQISTALHADGSLRAWYTSHGGMMGDVPAGNDFTLVSAGAYHAIALRTDGSLVVWGSNSWGTISDAPTSSNFIHVSAGLDFCVAVDEDGFVTTWGSEGWNDVVSNSPTDSGYAEVFAGRTHVAALREDGTLFSWGLHQSAGAPPAGSDFVTAASANDKSIALREDGTIAVWGSGMSAAYKAAVLKEPGFLQVAATWAGFMVQKPNGLIVGATGGNQGPFPKWGVKWMDISGGGSHVSAIWELDCDYDGTSDYTEILTGESQDCNGNEVPDSCDIKGGYSQDINGDGIPDECAPPALWANVYELSIGSGGTQDLFLTAPNGTDVYLLLGSISGTSPGITAGGFTLPLNEDTYLHRTLTSPNLPPLSGSFGTLVDTGFGGTANAALTLPAGLAPGLVGLTLNHAFATLDAVSGAVTFVSNAAPLDLVP